MIIVITYTEKINGMEVQVASHGENLATGERVILPSEPVASLAKFNSHIGEWILKD